MVWACSRRRSPGSGSLPTCPTHPAEPSASTSAQVPTAERRVTAEWRRACRVPYGRCGSGKGGSNSTPAHNLQRGNHRTSGAATVAVGGSSHMGVCQWPAAQSGGGRVSELRGASQGRQRCLNTDGTGEQAVHGRRGMCLPSHAAALPAISLSGPTHSAGALAGVVPARAREPHRKSNVWARSGPSARRPAHAMHPAAAAARNAPRGLCGPLPHGDWHAPLSRSGSAWRPNAATRTSTRTRTRRGPRQARRRWATHTRNKRTAAGVGPWIQRGRALRALAVVDPFVHGSGGRRLRRAHGAAHPLVRWRGREPSWRFRPRPKRVSPTQASRVYKGGARGRGAVAVTATRTGAGEQTPAGIVLARRDARCGRDRVQVVD